MTLLASSEVRSILQARYPRAVVLVLDKDYNVASEDAMDAYFEELWNDLKTKYGDKWEEFFDCDNFSFEAVGLAYRKHSLARREGAGSAQGIAFGLVGLTIPAHCIASRIGADRQVHEFEPQTRKPSNLTPEQCATAFFVLYC